MSLKQIRLSAQAKEQLIRLRLPAGRLVARAIITRHHRHAAIVNRLRLNGFRRHLWHRSFTVVFIMSHHPTAFVITRPVSQR